MRRLIEKQVLGLTGLSLQGVNYHEPRGDIGLYGPDSMVWRVHADFTSMLCGGVSALLLQMLEPMTLAGVWDHSNFREDMLGRLRRTAQFISGTSFGPRSDALALVEKVRRIHGHIAGHCADGRPYYANDPQLLTCVHVTEVSSFLKGYMQYKGALSDEEQDRYLTESALTARLLGAEDIPTTRVQVEDYLQAMRSRLLCDERTEEVRDVLLRGFAGAPQLVPMFKLFMAAGVDLLPVWAADVLDLPMSGRKRRMVRQSVSSMAAILRWAVRDSASIRARQRVASLPLPGSGLSV